MLNKKAASSSFKHLINFFKGYLFTVLYVCFIVFQGNLICATGVRFPRGERQAASSLRSCRVSDCLANPVGVSPLPLQSKSFFERNYSLKLPIMFKFRLFYSNSFTKNDNIFIVLQFLFRVLPSLVRRLVRLLGFDNLCLHLVK